MTAYNREQAGIGEYASDTPDDEPTDTPPNQEPVSPQPVPDSEPVKDSSS